MVCVKIISRPYSQCESVRVLLFLHMSTLVWDCVRLLLEFVHFVCVRGVCNSATHRCCHWWRRYEAVRLHTGSLEKNVLIKLTLKLLDNRNCANVPGAVLKFLLHLISQNK